MKERPIMKHYLLATAALAVLTTHAQLSGPNRTGPGASPGTFQTPGAVDSSVKTTTPDLPPLTTEPPDATPRTGPLPRTTIGSPDATDGALTDSLRPRTSFPSSRDWETGAVGGSPSREVGRDSSRLTPPPTPNLPNIAPQLPDVTPRLDPIRGGGPDTAVNGAQRPLRSDLNTTGVNTPPSINEQPLDKALSAKIRAQLSEPVGTRSGSSAMNLAPETVRDLRITSQNGRIVLEGMVNTPAEKQVIEKRAKEVPGVIGVDDRITIRNRPAGSPASGQNGQADSSATSGQTKQNRSDLHELDDHRSDR
jgi:hypothetical protein